MASGTNFAAVPITFITEACFTPRKTIKLKPQINADPQIMESKLFPPAKCGGKK